MRRLALLFTILLAFILLPICPGREAVAAESGSQKATEFRLSNNDVYRGEPVSFNEDGFVVRQEIGGFSPRISWTRVSQESLKEIARDYPQARQYAEPFIIVPPEVKARERARRRHVDIRDVPRVERPAESELTAVSTITAPAVLLILAVLFLANLYAAYEVAIYRNRPPGLVCSVSVFLPIISPILFLALPPAAEGESEGVPAEVPEPAAAPAAAAAGAGGGLALAAAEKGVAAQGPIVYKRGDTTFNRRFFETKLPGFFRLVPSEAEKDLVLSIRTVKSEIVAKRITRIATNEMHVQPFRGGEVMVQFGEITEIHVRHKDAKG